MWSVLSAWNVSIITDKTVLGISSTTNMSLSEIKRTNSKRWFHRGNLRGSSSLIPTTKHSKHTTSKKKIEVPQPRSGNAKLRAEKSHKRNIFQHTAAIFQLAKIVLIISKSEQKCWKKQGTQNPKQNKQKKKMK